MTKSKNYVIISYKGGNLSTTLRGETMTDKALQLVKELTSELAYEDAKKYNIVIYELDNVRDALEEIKDEEKDYR